MRKRSRNESGVLFLETVVGMWHEVFIALLYFRGPLKAAQLTFLSSSSSAPRPQAPLPSGIVLPVASAGSVFYKGHDRRSPGWEAVVRVEGK